MDGVTCKVNNKQLKEYFEICNAWCKETKFIGEWVKYKKYARTSVNDYLTIVEGEYDKDGKFYPKSDIKQKGDFVDKIDLEKGYGCPIIPIALNKYFVEGKSVIETIINHDDIYDFCKGGKNDPKFKLEYRYVKDGEVVIEELQKTNRYYVSKSSGTIVKIDGDKETRVEAGYNLTIFNDYEKKDMEDYKIDYSYYILEANKILYKVMNNFQQSLF